MSYRQITIPRLRALEAKWRPLIRRVVGAPPPGFGLVHMNAESNGEPAPTVCDFQLRPIGIMQVPYRIGRAQGRTETDLEDTTTNVYVWAVQTNRDARDIHEAYPSDWSTPNIDFWLAVRLFWILRKTTFTRLYDTARAVGTSYRGTAGLLSWIRTRMTNAQHFGRYTLRDLQRKADHLDEFKHGLVALEGANFVAAHFTEPPAVTPGNPLKARMIGATV